MPVTSRRLDKSNKQRRIERTTQNSFAWHERRKEKRERKNLRKKAKRIFWDFIWFILFLGTIAGITCLSMKK